MTTSSLTRLAWAIAFSFAFILAPAGTVWGKTKLASVFADNMVLQRGRPVPIWGWANPSETITVMFANQKKMATADSDGKWMVKLDPLKASSEPRELTVSGATTNILKNVLVGEVWLCGGQSNMGLALQECFEAPQEIAAANHPQFRFLRLGSPASKLPAADRPAGRWMICTPETAAGFAGTAYFFGRSLHRELKIPIGLIEFDRGATGIECWVPLEAYQASNEPALQQIYRRAAGWNPNSEIGKQAHEDAFRAIKQWVPAARLALQEKRPVPPQPRLPAPDPYQADPCVVYNGTIHPLVPYAIRGAVWYQGESNPGEGKIYQHKMEAMIQGWRRAWGQGDFPFYYVQLANEGNVVQDPIKETGFRYVPVREAQRRALRIPNTGMVVAIDLGEDASGHPRNKRDVGERLALWARAKTYDQKVPFSGPLYRSSRVDGDRMVILFDYTGGGLMIGDKRGLEPVREVKDGVLKQFSISGADGKWHWAEARMVAKTVVVRSDKVPAPLAVRYADSMNPKGPKLYNREGLPASPFRTDDW